MNAASPKARTATYQQIAILIDHFVAASMIMKERFFSQLIFSFLIANALEHMKNFGLVKTSRNDFVMAPLFNMLCTRLHELGPELAAPGGLYEGDCDTPEFREYGHYTRNEFTAFGRRIGIAPARVEKILDQFVKENNQANELIDQAFLPMEAKNIIRYNFMERSYRLK
jgi:serine/threonine-protein kinase HipA